MTTEQMIWSEKFEAKQDLLNMFPDQFSDPDEAEAIQMDCEELLALIAEGREDDPAVKAASEDVLALLDNLSYLEV